MSDPVSANHSTSPKPRRAPAKEFFTHLVRMPRWQLKVMIVAGVLAVAGLIGQASRMVATAPAEEHRSTETKSAESTDTPRSGFMADNRTSRSEPAPATIEPPPAPEPNVYQRLSPTATRLGVGFLGGFIIGWAFRAFLKVMALVTVVAAALFWGLNHFNLLDIDITAAQSSVDASTTWLSEQAQRLKDHAMTVLPSSFSSLFGAFLGFRRK